MKLKDIKFLLLLLTYLNIESYAAPSEPTSTVTTKNAEVSKEGEVQPEIPKVTKLHIRSSISNRFAYTTITSQVINTGAQAQEATFSAVLPEAAFISKFVIEIDGQNYTADVIDKEEAEDIYDQAEASGVGAAHIAVGDRDSKIFTVSVNIEPEKKTSFYLTYEQLLKRKDGRYEQVININPGQFVKDLSVEVAINEHRKITDLQAPALRPGNETENENAELDPKADIEVLNETAAIVKFSPNLERQKQLATLLNPEQNYGFSGQFVVQYDVERDPTGGEVLVQDGYFVHFFAPTELEHLSKHIVFVVDTSIDYEKHVFEQLKEAMGKILEQLNPKDLFHLVDVNSVVRICDLENPENKVLFPDHKTKKNISDDSTFPKASIANQDNIKKAKDIVFNGEKDHNADFLTALRAALHLTNLTKKQNVDKINRQPIILLLTGVEYWDWDDDEITEQISELNTGSSKTSIFSISFGSEVDKRSLQELSLRNYGFSKHIYEDADASLQLQDFNRQISSLLLAAVKFKYEPTVTSLTDTEFPIYFVGSEIIIAGWCGPDFIKSPEVDGIGSTGHLVLKPTVNHANSSIERLWAYLTVQQLLKEIEDEGKQELSKKALHLALKYSFVTPLTSLVNPYDRSLVDTGETSDDPKYVEDESDDEESYDVDLYIEDEFEDLLDELPWLEDNLNENKFLKLSTGSYKLGLNETITDYEACPNSGTSRCVLLKDCFELYSDLKTLDDYIHYSCIVKNEYAGVCCPIQDPL